MRKAPRARWNLIDAMEFYQETYSDPGYENGWNKWHRVCFRALIMA